MECGNTDIVVVKTPANLKLKITNPTNLLQLLDDKSKIVCVINATTNVKTCGTSNFIKDDLSLRASAGLSIFWKSPMGPIRFDFSKVLSKEEYDRPETFRFSTSTRF